MPEKSSVFCEHANECPQRCPCGPDCYCRDHTCKNRAQEQPVPTKTKTSSACILGILGLAGSGKDAVAKFLGQDCGYVNVAFADPLKRIVRDVYDFSEEQLWGPSEMRNKPDLRYPRDHSWYKVDEVTCACCGRSMEEAKGVQCYLTPRYSLQICGTEFGRHCYPETWAKMGVRTARSLLTGPSSMRYSQKRGIYNLPEVRDWGAAEQQEADRPLGVTISDVRFRNEIRVIREAGGRVIRIKRPGAGLQGARGLHPSEAEQAGIPDEEFDAVINNDRDLDSLRGVSRATISLLTGV